MGFVCDNEAVGIALTDLDRDPPYISIDSCYLGRMLNRSHRNWFRRALANQPKVYSCRCILVRNDAGGLHPADLSPLVSHRLWSYGLSVPYGSGRVVLE